MARVVISCSTRSGSTVESRCLDGARLYGITHRKFNGCSNVKKYKLHQKRDGSYAAVGFRNSTGHLNEAEGFDSLEDAFNYCKEHGHTMTEFENTSEFGRWLV